jgi:tetraacyldisaccharide 4'-kinase
VDRLLEAIWYKRHPLGLVLAPVGWCYAAAATVRRLLYRCAVLPSHRVGVPVVVVGNVSVGGTGKTPLVAWLARYLAQVGFQPGIVTRGYGGNATQWPQQVRPDADPVVVGDEPVLLARRGGCPVAAGPDRVAAARALVAHQGCDLILSDDGLQHLALARDVEIVLVDGIRRHGNRRCLPAGPLRESLGRLRSVDMVVANGGAQRGEFEMRLAPWNAVNLAEPSTTRALRDFPGGPVHAVCGIGHPERFFVMLEGLGLTVERHPFPDHHPFEPADLDFGDALPVLMTEKDAVKCQRFVDSRYWYVPVRAELRPAFAARLMSLLGRPVPEEVVA